MVPGPNFYIYGGGRWRELDITSGNVEGWGRARFAYAKRGKVLMAKARTVLAALRDHKAARKSAIKDGARIPDKKPEAQQKKEEKSPEKGECSHSHCCHYNNNESLPRKTIKPPTVKVYSGTQSVTKIDAAIQTTLPNSLDQKTDKRRSENDSDENVPTQRTTAIVNTRPKRALAKLKLRKAWSLAHLDKVSRKKKVLSTKLNKTVSTHYKRKRIESRDSLVGNVLPKTRDTEGAKLLYNSSEYVKTAFMQKRRRRESTNSKSSQDSLPKNITKRVKSVGDIKPHIQNTNKTNPAPNDVFKNNNEKLKQSASNLANDVLTSRPESNSELISNSEKAKPARQDKFKELIIDDGDVIVLRNYLMHNFSDFDLLKFDEDDEYKKQLFYTINPLVNLERSQEIARMLGKDSTSEISLKVFASQLGLTSVSDKQNPRRYNLRNRNSDRDNDHSDSETDKNNSYNVKNIVNKGSGGYANHKRYSTDAESASDFKEEIRKVMSLSLRSQNRTAQSSKRYITRQSVGETKDINRKQDVIETFSESDGESSLTEVLESRKLRKRKTGSAKNVNLSSDSEVSLKRPPRRGQNNKMNKVDNGNKINNADFTKFNGIDSDSAFETEQVKRLSKRKNTHTNANDETTEVGSIKNFIKGDGQKNSISETNNRTNIEEKSGDSKQSIMTRNKKGQIMKKYNTLDNSKADKIYLKEAAERKQKSKQPDSEKENFSESSETEPLSGNNKHRFLKRKTTVRKKDVHDSSEDISEAEDKLLKEAKTRSQKNKLNSSRRTNDNNKIHFDSNAENSENDFRSKEVRSDMQNKLNNTNSNKNDSEEEFVHEKKITNIRHNKTYDVKSNNINNMNTNDENQLEECKSRTRKNKHKSNTKKHTNDNNPNEGQSETNRNKKQEQNKLNSKNNDSTETLHINSDHCSDIFVRPIIGETKSLLIKSTARLERPPSSASSLQRVEYSNLEDHAIVTWISMGGRARCVNGNRIWRELQDRYPNIAGQNRSWHSLRNRYLRSILPRLGQLALNPSLVARLRAAAATGEIKSRKDPSRRNSIFAAPVPGALSRQPRAQRSPSSEEKPPHKRHKHDHTSQLHSSPRRVLRSSLHSSPEKARRTPRCSEVTRFFAGKYRESTPSSSETERRRKNSLERVKVDVTPLETKKSEKTPIETKKSKKTSLETKKTAITSLETKRAGKIFSETKSPKNKSSVERLRSKESSSKSSPANKSPVRNESEKSPEKERKKTRKLFNPSSRI